MRWHYVITDKMRAAGLTGNALLVFAVLDGYSQNRQGCYYGTREYLCEVVGVSRRTLMEILRKLEEDGFITSTERPGKSTLYTTCDLSERGADFSKGGQILHGRGADFAPDNNSDNASTSRSPLSPGACAREDKFVAPTVEEVRSYAEAEGYTLVDAAAFWGHYQSVGWKVGSKPMKEWKAAVVGWNAREAKRQAETPAGRPSTSRAREPETSAASRRFHRMMDMYNQIKAENEAREGRCDEQ